MKNGTTKYILPLILIALVIGGLVFMAVTKRSGVRRANHNRQYEAVMAMDFENDYPDSPDAVLEKYNEIDTFISGNTTNSFTDADLDIVVKKIRMLLHPELLELNPAEAHVSGYKEKMQYIKENDLRVLQVKAETPRFSEDAKICTIGSKQFWNKVVDNEKDARTLDYVFNIKKDGSGKWKILGWSLNS